MKSVFVLVGILGSSIFASAAPLALAEAEAEADGASTYSSYVDAHVSTTPPDEQASGTQDKSYESNIPEQYRNQTYNDANGPNQNKIYSDVKSGTDNKNADGSGVTIEGSTSALADGQYTQGDNTFDAAAGTQSGTFTNPGSEAQTSDGSGANAGFEGGQGGGGSTANATEGAAAYDVAIGFGKSEDGGGGGGGISYAINGGGAGGGGGGGADIFAGNAGGGGGGGLDGVEVNGGGGGGAEGFPAALGGGGIITKHAGAIGFGGGYIVTGEPTSD